MSKTNSNSITSLLVCALNDKESTFRGNMLCLFGKKIGRKIHNDVVFYNSTSTPLLYEKMNGAEIDIVARVLGKHRPELIIEVKAGIKETLQDTQKVNGEYEKTSKHYGIPLLYVIPKDYHYKYDKSKKGDCLPRETKRDEWKENGRIKYVTWEEIYKITDTSFKNHIEEFVDISYVDIDSDLKEEEIEIYKDEDLLLAIYTFKENVCNAIIHILENEKKINNPKREETPYGVGYYYTYKDGKKEFPCFVGFNPWYSEKNCENQGSKNFLALAIEESVDLNKMLDCPEKEETEAIYFEDGYYFLPVKNETKKQGNSNNTILQNDILKKLQKGIESVLKKMKEQFPNIFFENNKRSKKIPADIQNDFFDFLNLQAKIINKTNSEEIFKNLFIKEDKKMKEDEYIKYRIDQKKYESLSKRLNLTPNKK